MNKLCMVSFSPRVLINFSSNSQIYYIMLYRLQLAMNRVRTHKVIYTDCIGSCKSNYHTITITTVPLCNKMHVKFISDPSIYCKLYSTSYRLHV